MPRIRSSIFACAATMTLAAASIAAVPSSSADEPPAVPSSASGSSSVSASISASISSSASASPPTPPPPRRKHEEPEEVEIVQMSDEPEPDPQALAIGLQAGGGAIHTRGDGTSIVPAADFAFTLDIGLGPGGAHVPWVLQPFAAFAVTRASISGGVNVVPDRWTEIGVRLVWRGEGALDGHWVSLGAGGVWTSYRTDFTRACHHLTDADPCTEVVNEKRELIPAPLVDVGVGVQEWTTRVARYGILVRAPFELYPSHWGWGAIVALYGQVGFRR